ncbi:MAG: GxxExxY protein [Bacteroidetes bacterium]|nr:GxxExxY protein [Bacteroidota bacterium]
MMELIFKKESYDIIGCCMEVHGLLGKGFQEIVYKDALEIEFNQRKILYRKEKEFDIVYKGNKLPHFYKADFVIEDKIILEVKAIEELLGGHIKQILNYLAASKLKLGLLVNFGQDNLDYKRIVL